MKRKPVALITGANRGIGKAIAIDLAKAGYDIAGISRTIDQRNGTPGLRDLKPILYRYGAKLYPYQADISALHMHEQIIAELTGICGGIDILVNNAGIAPHERRNVLDMTPKSFDEVLAVNLRGTFFLTQAVARDMIRKKKTIPDYKPKIIFITSVSAEVSSVNRAEYCISKAGCSMAVKIFADRLAREGIPVYEIRPGIIRTDMTAAVTEKYDLLIKDGLIPQNRWGEPEDVAAVVKAITTGAFDYSTGMVFDVSGGMNIQSL